MTIEQRFETTVWQSEFRVAKLCALGFTNKEVGRQLKLSSKTVQAHIANFYLKARKILGVPQFDRIHLVHLMYRLGKSSMLYSERNFAPYEKLWMAAVRMPRTLEVGRLTAEGIPVPEIAKRMEISELMVGRFLSELYRIWKHHLHEPTFNRIHLVHLMYQLGKLEVLFPHVAKLASADICRKFTLREIDVAQRLASGKTRKIIASELWIDIATVDRHLRQIYTKGRELLQDSRFGRVRLVHLMHRLGQVDLLHPELTEMQHDLETISGFPRARKAVELVALGLEDKYIAQLLTIKAKTAGSYRQFFYSSARQIGIQSTDSVIITHVALRLGTELLYPRITPLSARELINQ